MKLRALDLLIMSMDAYLVWSRVGEKRFNKEPFKLKIFKLTLKLLLIHIFLSDATTNNSILSDTRPFFIVWWLIIVNFDCVGVTVDT